MLNYKRGVVKYSFFLSNGTQYEVEEEVYHVYQNETKIGFMSNDEDLKEWFFYKNIDSDYLCGGLTLKEAKESLSRCLSSEHWNAKEVQEYFNN
tara:strand:- start:184 stop:465 length:282 start_codon:yes stop_codon:yes gene_type:complete